MALCGGIDYCLNKTTIVNGGLLTQDKGTYKVYDLFFAIWLVKNF